MRVCVELRLAGGVLGVKGAGGQPLKLGELECCGVWSFEGMMGVEGRFVSLRSGVGLAHPAALGE